MAGTCGTLLSDKSLSSSSMDALELANELELASTFETLCACSGAGKYVTPLAGTDAT